MIVNPLFRLTYSIYGFFKRDALNAMSYKFEFGTSIISMFITALSMGILGIVTQSAQAPYMTKYGGMNATTFILIGAMTNNFLIDCQIAPREIVNPGVTERALLSPCRLPVFILGQMSWGHLWSTMNFIVYVFVGVTLFNMQLQTINAVTFLIVLFLGILCMWGLGIIAAAIQLVTKRWDPISWFFFAFTQFASGIFYSPEALLAFDRSGILYSIAWCIPHTYVFDMIRQSFVGKSLALMIPSLLNLSALVTLLFGMGWITLRLCIRRCQVEGSLGWA